MPWRAGRLPSSSCGGRSSSKCWGRVIPLRELKKVRCHISYPFLADPYGTLRLVFSGGRKVRCRCVADVKEVRGRLIALMEEDALR